MASISSLATLTSMSGSSFTRPIPLALILLLVLLVTGDARVETRLAAGFNRRNRSLQGSPPLWSAELSSASQCLGACIQLGCQSLTYGHGRCELFPTFLCHPEDRFHLSLVPAAGVTYFDLGSEQANVKTLWSSEGCLLYGRCLEKCNEGPWTKPTPPASTTTTTPSKATAAVDVGSATEASISDGNTELKRSTVEPTGPISSAPSAARPAAIKGAATPTAKPEELGARIALIQEPMTFNDSLDECRRRNMSLAMPETRAEHDILVEAMKKRKIGRMWIGVRKITEGGKDATYVDGRSVSGNLLLWGDGQPNNSRGKQICVEMIASLKYLWNDFDCLYKSAFVCR